MVAFDQSLPEGGDRRYDKSAIKEEKLVAFVAVLP